MTPESAQSSSATRAQRVQRMLRKHFGAVLAALAGFVLLQPVGDDLTRLSFDIPFAFRKVPVNEAVIIYLDERSHQELGQPFGRPWDRGLHASLLDILTAARARAVVFDIIFDEPHTNSPGVDELFAQAIKANGRVVLAAERPRDMSIPGIAARNTVLPYEPFARAAARWGNAQLEYDPDFGVRRHFTNLRDVPGHDVFPSLAWSAAKVVEAPSVNRADAEFATRWMNYYGPADIVPGFGYSSVIRGDVPEEFFKDKVVFVGVQRSAEFSGAIKDEFVTPYSRWSGESYPGVEVHATALVNLLRGDWLLRVPRTVEWGFILLFGAALGVAMVWLKERPFRAELTAVGLVLVGTVLANVMALWLHVWFAWLILPIQTVVAYLCALIRHTLILRDEKNLLTRSLTLHLSPARVQQLMKDETLLKPGGKQQEISVLFTDIQDFSKLAQLKTPEDLFRMLNNYYAAALKGVHETDGTVVQLIGDAIFAVWNAPLPHADHRARACRAAVELHAHLADFEPRRAGRPQFVTRVGVHTGTAVVGNLGSQNWFEFTAIGETVNLASRLEGLNKHLGTDILATRAIQSAVESEMTCRYVGLFQFKGFGTSVEVHEIFGKLDVAEATRAWRQVFDEALQLFQAGRFGAAEAKFREAIAARRSVERASALPGEEPRADGPSEFYLERIEEFRHQPPPESWRGEIVMREK